jgi:hypothetical protein
MAIPIPIVDSLIEAGKSILDKIFMDKADKEKIEITKEELRKNFEITLRQMTDNKELAILDKAFQEYEAQRQYANDQFGTVDALANMGWVGKTILLGRASIRWVITGGSMFFTWKIVNAVLTDQVVSGLAVGTLGGSAPYIVGLLICLIVGVPIFYVSGISIEKIMNKRNSL